MTSYFTEYHRRYKVAGPRRRRGDGVVDEIAIERALRRQYDAARLTHQEITAAVRVGTSWGLTDGEIGKRLGMTVDAVLKRRQRAGIPAPNPPYFVGRRAS